VAPSGPSMDRPTLVSLDQRHAAEIGGRFPESAPERKLTGWSDATIDHVDRDLHAWKSARKEIPTTRFNVRDAAFSAVEDQVLDDLAALISVSRELSLEARDPDVVSTPLSLLLVEACAIGTKDRDAAQRLAERVRTLPSRLDGARANVKRAPAPLIEWARHVAKHTPALLTGLLTRVHDAAGEASTAELRSALDDLRPNLAAHERFLDGLQEDTSLPAAIGKDALDALLKARRLDLDSSEIKEMARSFIDVARLEQRRLRKRAFRSRTLDEASLLARTQTPYSLEEAVAWSSELVDQCRAFLAENGSFPLRGQDPIHVEEGSSAHGAVFGALSYVRACGTGPARLILSDADDEIGLARFSVSDLEASMARLAYPGQHLSVTLARRGDSPIRAGLLQDGAFASTALYGLERVEGWSLFAETTMRELHFRDSPAVRLVTIQRLLAAALLAWYDVRLAQGECTVDEAAAGLTVHGAMPASLARRHALRLARSPTSGLSALVGRVRLDQLRRAAHTSWRHGYSERRFNDLVLLSGHIPVSHLFSLLDAFSPFNLDEGTAEYEVGEHPNKKIADVTSEG
jgi:hypothetical protein